MSSGPTPLELLGLFLVGMHWLALRAGSCDLLVQEDAHWVLYPSCAPTPQKLRESVLLQERVIQRGADLPFLVPLAFLGAPPTPVLFSQLVFVSVLLEEGFW